MKRRFRKPFSHHGAAKAGDGAKGIEMKIKEALQTGKLRLAGLSLRTPPLQKYLDVASAGTDGVNFWQVIDLRTLDISHNEISSIPDCLRAFQSLEILSMKHNQLAVLPPAACSLVMLRSLDVSHCHLAELPTEFSKLSALVSLSVQHNQLQDISVVSFLPKLQILRASDNGLRNVGRLPACLVELSLSNNPHLGHSLGQNTLSCLDSLENIELAGCGICEVYPSFQSLHSLKSLDLRSNKISRLPFLPNSRQLDTVLLGRNQICDIQACDFTVAPSVSVLDLSENKLQELPDMLCCLGYLKTLDVSNNDLTNLPHGLGYIKSLTRIVVEGNALRRIRSTLRTQGALLLKQHLRSRGPAPDCLHVSQRVELDAADESERSALCVEEIVTRTRDGQRSGELKLSCCGLENISAGQVREHLLSALPNIHVLDLSRNRLSGLDAGLCSQFPRGLKLNIADNEFQTLPSCLGAVALPHLDIHGNQLKHDGLGALAGKVLRETLLHLDLRSNNLSDLPGPLFCLENLQTLLLGRNKLQANLAAMPWEQLSSLSVLDLSKCNLSQIPSTFHCLPLAELDVSDNNISKLPAIISLSRTLKVFRISGNPLRSIRHNVVAAGTAAILAFLGKKLPLDMQSQVEDSLSARRFGERKTSARMEDSFGATRHEVSHSHAQHAEQKNTDGLAHDPVIQRLDGEIKEFEDELSDTTGLSAAGKWALKKKLKMAKAARIRRLRELANRKTV